MTVVRRIIALERRILPETLGYHITRTAPDGTIKGDIVMIPAQGVNRRARHVTRARFARDYPGGRIVSQLILEDDGRPVAPRSLAAAWFEDMES